MPIYALSDDLRFPPAAHAEPGGLLAIGGDLRPQRLLNAYANGIFPWYSAGEPILWYSTDPRLVLFPEQLKIHKSMRPILRGDRFKVTFDRDFAGVIQGCAGQYRPNQDGTWLGKDMIQAYTKLHELGYVHSVEVWEGSDLVGGLYGVALGRCFFGESMFARVPNASKAGFIRLVQGLRARKYELIDCQQSTSHLISLGATEISRTEFLRRLDMALQQPTDQGPWSELPELNGAQGF